MYPARRQRFAFMEKYYVNIAADLEAAAAAKIGEEEEEEDEEPVNLPENSKAGPFTNIDRYDVLMERGRYANTRPGNEYYRVLLESCCDAYANCTTQKEKTEFTNSIVRKIKSVGRFVQRVSKTKYVEITDESARVKVGQVSIYIAMSEITCYKRETHKKEFCRSSTQLSVRLTSLLPFPPVNLHRLCDTKISCCDSANRQENLL